MNNNRNKFNNNFNKPSNNNNFTDKDILSKLKEKQELIETEIENKTERRDELTEALKELRKKRRVLIEQQQLFTEMINNIKQGVR